METSTNRKMTIPDIFKRCSVTLVAGAISSPVASIAFEIAWWKAAAMAGMTAVVNLVGRMAQRWLKDHPED